MTDTSENTPGLTPQPVIIDQVYAKIKGEGGGLQPWCNMTEKEKEAVRSFITQPDELAKAQQRVKELEALLKKAARYVGEGYDMMEDTRSAFKSEFSDCLHEISKALKNQ